MLNISTIFVIGMEFVPLMPCQDEQLLALTEYNISFTHKSTILYKTDMSA